MLTNTIEDSVHLKNRHALSEVILHKAIVTGTGSLLIDPSIVS